MKIGITGPILVKSLEHHLDSTEQNNISGMGGTAVNIIINGLLKLGHQVSVYSLDPKATEKTILSGRNLKIYFGRFRGKARYQMLDNFYYESRQIRDFIIEDKPDIVHAHWTYEYAMGAIMSKYPHLITFRDESWEILKYFKDIYRFFRLILDFRVRYRGKNFSVNSIYLQEKLKYFKEGLPVISNPINEEEILDKPKIHPEKTMKIVSSLNGWSKRKNPEVALQAFRMLRDEFGEKVEYHLYGPGFEPDKDGYLWAKGNHLLEGVYFHGEVNHVEMMKMFSTMDVMLHPALEESFGNTLIEGLAKGLPVIAGEKAGAVPWVLNEGKNGLLVDVTSPEAIYNALKQLVIDQYLYNTLSADGLGYVKENFSSMMIARKYTDLYEQILGSETVSINA